MSNLLADYDGTYDPAYADHLASDDDVTVTYDGYAAIGGGVKIRRAVNRNSYRAKDRVCLHDELVALLTREQALMLINDLVNALVER